MSEVKISQVTGKAFHSLIHDVFEHGHTHYDMRGGRGSLKSSTVSLIVPVLIVQNQNIHAVVYRKVGTTLRQSVYAQYIWAIDMLGMSDLWKKNLSPLELIYKKTGQKIMFRGADDPDKSKSVKVEFGYIAITHFEEKDQFSGRSEIRKILQSTMRGGPRFWNFETYNPPISKDNWANKDSEIDRPDRLRHKSTYHDVPVEWLGEQFILEAEALKEINERAYRHEYEGEAVGTGSEVFENVEIREITSAEIAQFDRIRYGVDWGYYPDPWAFNKCYYNPAQLTLYVFDELTAYKLGNEATAKKLLAYGITKEHRIIADSAEPKSIADYNQYGLKCAPAVKGQGSVERSMRWLQSLKKIVIDPKRCPDTKAEFVGYEYEKTKEGEIISGYPDMNNHHIDAIRYATNDIWLKPAPNKQQGKVSSSFMM